MSGDPLPPVRIRDRKTGIVYHGRIQAEANGKVRVIDRLFPMPRYTDRDGKPISVQEMGGDVAERIIRRRQELERALAVRSSERPVSNGRNQ